MAKQPCVTTSCSLQVVKEIASPIVPCSGFFISYARCWVGKRATANGLVLGFTIFAIASLAEGSCLGIAKAGTFITLSPHFRPTWGTVMLPTHTGI